MTISLYLLLSRGQAYCAFRDAANMGRHCNDIAYLVDG